MKGYNPIPLAHLNNSELELAVAAGAARNGEISTTAFELKYRQRPEDAEKRLVEAAHARQNAAYLLAQSSTEHLTDLGNARRLVILHGQDLRFCSQIGWLYWDGKRWAKDETGEVTRRAKMTVRAIYEEAARVEDEDLRKALATHAKRSEAEPRVKAMVTLAESEPGIPVLASQLDRDPWLLNVGNGTLDLRTGDLYAHRREDLITKLTPVPYDPEAHCSAWHKFLERITGASADLVWFLQRSLGYSLTGDTREQCFFILYGTGSNGKSTFLKTAALLLGDYARATPIETFLVKRGDSIPNDVARLKGARFVSAVETEGGKRLAESLVKQLTGGDKVAARFLHREFFEFEPTFKLWLAANHKPKIKGTDHAIWRRIRLVPFTVTIPDSEQDKDLPDKLKEELPGILRWAVEGCEWWLRDGLGTPQAVKVATAGYQTEMDVIGNFLAECTESEDGATVTTKELYDSYVRWCEQAGEKPITKRDLGTHLSERGFESARNWQGRFWQGLSLRKHDA